MLSCLFFCTEAMHALTGVSELQLVEHTHLRKAIRETQHI